MKLRILSAAAACLVLASCEKSNIDSTKTAPSILGSISTLNQMTSRTNGEGAEVTLTDASVSTSRLVFDDKATKFSSGDEIGLYGVEWVGTNMNNLVVGKLTNSGNIIDNHQYIYNGNSWESEPLHNSLTWRKISFYGYYPHNAASNNALAHELTKKEGNSYDYFIYGEAKGNSGGYQPLADPKPIEIGFTHQMAECNVNITLPNSYLGEQVTRIDGAQVAGTPVSATFNLENGNINTSVETQNATMIQLTNSGLAATFRAAVPPKKYAAGAPMFNISYTTANGQRTLTLNAPKAGFELAKANRYNFTMESPYEFYFKDNGASLNSSYVPKGGETRTFGVVSTDPDVKWRLELGGGMDEWAQLGNHSTSGSQDGITIKFDPNNTTSIRMGTLRLIDNTIGSNRVVEVVVTQIK